MRPETFGTTLVHVDLHVYNTPQAQIKHITICVEFFTLHSATLHNTPQQHARLQWSYMLINVECCRNVHVCTTPHHTQCEWAFKHVLDSNIVDTCYINHKNTLTKGPIHTVHTLQGQGSATPCSVPDACRAVLNITINYCISLCSQHLTAH